MTEYKRGRVHAVMENIPITDFRQLIVNLLVCTVHDIKSSLTITRNNVQTLNAHASI